MGCNISFLSKKHTLIEKRVLILGLDNAGKSCICTQLKEKQFHETTPTIGLNVETINITHFSINFWDIGGQATMLWKQYYEDTGGIIFVIDIADTSRFPNAQKEFTKMYEESASTSCPILIVGNKTDIEPLSKESDIKTLLNYEAVSKNRKLAYIETSAKLGSNIAALKDCIGSLLECNQTGSTVNTTPVQNYSASVN